MYKLFLRHYAIKLIPLLTVFLIVFPLIFSQKISAEVLPTNDVWAWGYNTSGQLGDGTTTNQTNPVQVNNSSWETSVSGGGLFSLALKSDGTVWSWGYNVSGQLGDGTTINRSNPVQVSGLDGVIAISAGTLHSLALKSDGTVWSWGYNGAGRFGRWHYD